MFEIKKFSSGEYDVKVNHRIYGNKAIIKWNWFDRSQRDVFMLLLKIDAIKRNYPNLDIEVHANYLPYLRQDRIFEAGQSVPANILIKLFKDVNVKVVTMAMHSYQKNITNMLFSLRKFPISTNIVFPDINAQNHYFGVSAFFAFDKVRSEKGISLQLDHKPNTIHTEHRFLICDDICAGGRTFIECANSLRESFGDNIQIELLIYHAFLDYGIDSLQNAGISKIHIINPDSYSYILNLYSSNTNYFNLINI